MTTFEKLIEDIKKVEYFKNYKFRKSDSTFIYKFNGGFNAVYLEHWCKYGYLNVRPTIGFHYDIVVKWFEKYGFKPLKIQRNNPLYFTSPGSLGWKGNATSIGDVFEFKLDNSDYEEISELFIHAITKCAQFVFDKFKTLGDYYDFEVKPYLTGEKDTPMGGADWFFEKLTVCRIVSPENYDQLKKIFMKRADWMINEWEYKPEMNMFPYYYRLDEILSDMESRFPTKDS